MLSHPDCWPDPLEDMNLNEQIKKDDENPVLASCQLLWPACVSAWARVSETDKRIVPFVSGGAVLDLDWFINYRDIKLAAPASEIERTVNFLAYCKH